MRFFLPLWKREKSAMNHKGRLEIVRPVASGEGVFQANRKKSSFYPEMSFFDNQKKKHSKFLGDFQAIKMELNLLRTLIILSHNEDFSKTAFRFLRGYVGGNAQDCLGNPLEQ
jgi:hypothetical protein